MQRTLLQVACLAFMTTSLAGTAVAQGRGRAATGYPPGFRPPPGMCRVWIQGLPPGQQPGVTDCVSARASANARVLYGDRDDNPAYHNQGSIHTRTVYDANGNRVLQRVRRDADGTLSVLSSRVYTGTNGIPGSVWPTNRNISDCNGAYRMQNKNGKWKSKCKGGDEDSQEGDRGGDEKESHGKGKGHGKHG